VGEEPELDWGDRVVVCLLGKEGMRNLGKRRERLDVSLDMVFENPGFSLVDRGEGREKLGMEGCVYSFIHRKVLRSPGLSYRRGKIHPPMDDLMITD
jgi:hypothetical protein